MKTLLITHTDLDGISPIILLHLTNINFEYKSIEIGDVDKTFNELFLGSIKNYDQIYITDLTLNESIYQKLKENNINYLVFDHHETHLFAENDERSTIKITLDNHLTCGTELFYNYLKNIYSDLNKPIIKDYVELVRQLDTFTFESDDGANLEIIRETFGKSKFIKTVLRRLKSNKEKFYFSNFEKRFIELKKDELTRLLEIKEEQMKVYLINNYKCGVIFSERNKSELGNHLALNNPDLDLIIIIDPAKGISYRTTKDNVKVNEFASLYGGGGHAKASGSRFNDQDRDILIKNYFTDALLIDKPIK